MELFENKSDTFFIETRCSCHCKLLQHHTVVICMYYSEVLCDYFCRALTFVYPFGATLNVAKPAVAVLSSGSVSYPLHRPVCAFYGLRVSVLVRQW